MNARDVIHFWFDEAGPEKWWAANADFDAAVRTRFATVHRAASRGELHEWRATADGRLAEIIVLDQFSRNMYRGTARAFACDPIALVLAQEAVARAADRALPASQRVFVYMPYMHSESLMIHEQAVALFSQPEVQDTLDYELKHKRIIERFGRYPHRNAILGRASTSEEVEFLKEEGSAF